MKVVEAVKNRDDLVKVPALLEKHYSVQMSCLWSLGVNVALRITDLISLKWSDIKGDTLSIKEGKTSKTANIKLNTKALEALSTLKSICTENGCNTSTGYVFPSVNSRHCDGSKPLSRQYVSRVFKEVGEVISVKLSTHSMRKTRGYHLYKESDRDIALVMQMLRHSNPATTLRYIGITQDDLNKSFTDMCL